MTRYRYKYLDLPTLKVWRFAPSYVSASRFARNVRVTDGCWIWTGHSAAGSCSPILYGRFGNGTNGTAVLAHRVAYMWATGPIPDGLTIDHLCFTPLCVNPAHLEAVTLRENIVRAARRHTHCKRGHEFTEENTYRPKSGGRWCLQCQRATSRAGYERSARFKAATRRVYKQLTPTAPRQLAIGEHITNPQPEE